MGYDDVFDGVITSPPYPGLIDYHEQHRYAYELLGLEEQRDLELGKGSTKAALESCARESPRPSRTPRPRSPRERRC